MSSSPSRLLSIALGAALAVGATLATVPAYANPEDTTTTQTGAGSDVSYPGVDGAITILQNDPAGPTVVLPNGVIYNENDAFNAEQNGVTLEAGNVIHFPADTILTVQPDGNVRGHQSTCTDFVVGLDGGISLWFGTGCFPGPNVIADANLRSCIADLMNDLGIANVPGISDYEALTQSITQDDLGYLASVPRDGFSTVNDYSISCSGVSTLDGLQYLNNSKSISLSITDGSVSDLAPLAGLSNLSVLDLHDNQISDLTPLAGLTNLYKLYLHNNEISDITPLASWFNSSVAEYKYWTLSGNHITDASSLDWNALGNAWLIVPSEYDKGTFNYAVNDQTLTQTGIAGATVPLPTVVQASNDPNPLIWTVVSGNATIDQAAGTITYTSAGPVKLAWADALTAGCPEQVIFTPTCADGTSPVNLSFFSGTVSVNVTGSGTVPVPSVPDSDVAKDKIVSPETTGGAARLADGSDTYTLVTTIRDENGQLLTGYLSHLSASVASDTADPTKVTLKNYRENTDKPGTYSIDVSSATPGNFIVTVAYDNTPLDTTTPAGADLHTTATPVNFIGADVAQPSRLIGDPQSSDGLGFLPGEDVTVTVHSDPLSLGSYKANTIGNVNVSFVTDKLDVGRHNVTFYGTTSGTVEAGFDVVVTPKGDTGGTAVNPSSTSALVLVFAFVAAGAFSLAMGLRRRTH